MVTDWKMLELSMLRVMWIVLTIGFYFYSQQLTMLHYAMRLLFLCIFCLLL